MSSKVCTGKNSCGKSKDISKFSVSHITKGGEVKLKPSCNSCVGKAGYASMKAKLQKAPASQNMSQNIQPTPVVSTKEFEIGEHTFRSCATIKNDGKRLKMIITSNDIDFKTKPGCYLIVNDKTGKIDVKYVGLGQNESVYRRLSNYNSEINQMTNGKRSGRNSLFHKNIKDCTIYYTNPGKVDIGGILSEASPALEVGLKEMFNPPCNTH